MFRLRDLPLFQYQSWAGKPKKFTGQKVEYPAWANGPVLIASIGYLWSESVKAVASAHI